MIDHAEMCARCGYTYGDHYGSECQDEEGPFTLKPPMNADEKLIEGLSAECDALKASNAELREQLAANAKSISELQHTLRLAHRTGTYAQQVRECAEKAAEHIYSGLERDDAMEPPHMVTIICEAFGAPVKDECEEALQTEWRRMDLAGERSTLADFRKGFRAAWTLAKGKP